MSECPRFRADLVLVEQSYRGEQSYIVKDPETRKYFRFRPAEIAVIRSLDGARTVAEAAAALMEQGLRVSASAVERFVDKLKGMGLCERTLGERSVLLMERLRAQRRARLRKGPFKGDILRLRWSVGDPDRLMDRTIPYLRFFFTRGFLLASLALFALQFVIVILKWPEFVAATTDLYLLRLSVSYYVLVWVLGMLMVAVHELGHGFTCKHYGGQVHEIGAMLFYFEVAFFCNVNDAWTFPERKARLWVTAAGSWIEMVVASLAAIVWWVAAPDSFASAAALALILIGGFLTVLVNMNPLVPLDGYYALSDWLEVPNLRRRAFGHLGWTIRSRWLGLDQPMPTATEREQRIFLLYATLAVVYTGFVFLVAGAISYGFLSRTLGAAGIFLFGVGMLLAIRQLTAMLRRPAAEAWRAWRSRWAERGDRRRSRPVLLVLAVGIALLGLLPWPITVTGPFAVAPAASGVVVAPDTGVVYQVLVSEGTTVSTGAPLALIRNLQLERDAVVGARAVDSLHLREMQARARRLDGEAARIAAEAKAETARVTGMRERIRALALRASEAAVVLTSRPDTLTGRMVSVGDTLLRLANPSGVEARIALDGAGASLAREGQPVRLVAHADPALRFSAAVASVAVSASPGGGVESRVRLAGAQVLRPGMTGEARITIRQSTVWGALWWGIRRRIRTDVLL